MFASIDGVLFRKADKTLLTFPEGKKVNGYIVPPGVQHIYRYAFYERSDLESIILPDGLLSIGDNAFSLCTSLRIARFA